MEIMMRNKRVLSSLLMSAAILALNPAAPNVQAAAAPDAAPVPQGGPLAPDGLIAKAYNDAAKALAEVNNNPIVDWQYRVWCVTGYRTPDDVGTGVAVDQLPAGPVTDLVSPKGVLHRSIGDNSPMPGAGAKFMDNAWYFGDDMTASVAVKTPDGIILYDALTTPEDAEKLIIAPMKAAGLNPADIKMIFVGHGHGDHTGGINTIRKYAPGLKVVAGKADADAMAASRERLASGQPLNPNRPNAAPVSAEERAHRLANAPLADIVVEPIPGFRHGAQKVKVGNTEIVAILNPGHTPGQMSIIAPVTWKGQPHKMLMWSGNDTGPQNLLLYASSGDWVRAVAQMEGADAYANTHGYQGAVFHHIRQVAANPNAAENPLILGVDGVQSLLGIFANCQRAFHHRLQDGTWKAF
jgi:glyoxylase-like metal-dependent hydrolase (beta-lactamase superfamily II)